MRKQAQGRAKIRKAKHNVRKQMLLSLLGLFLYLQAGCSLVGGNGRGLESRADLPVIDPNNGPYSIEIIQRSDGTRDYFWEIDSQIKQEKPCRVRYHQLYSSTRFMVVEGKLGNEGKKYPVVLDTGTSQPIFVNTTHVLDNKLPIYPMGPNKANLSGYNLGLCHLPELQIGNVTLLNWPTLYLEQHMKLDLLGLSIAKDDFIIVGLPALREFKYIVFDNVRKKVEFSHNKKLFEPKDPQLWNQYPFSIEEDFHGNAFLFVKIPIAGEEIELQLDTGSGRGLAIGEELWEGMRGKIHNAKTRKARDLYLYLGMLSCKRSVIQKLKVGQRIVKNAQISIFPNDSLLLEECQGLLGMQYFQDTVLVLDFQGNQMWVKNTQSQ